MMHSGRFAASLFVCYSLVLSVGVSAVNRPTSEIEAAFAADGFSIVSALTYNGSRGFVAQSHNTTVLSTGKHKLVHYVEGTPTEMGYLAGMLMEPSASQMTTTYIDHFIVSLISFALDEKLTNSPVWKGLYSDFTAFLGKWLTDEANKSFAKDHAKGLFPQELVDEMHGLAAGAQHVNPNTSVTLERVITLNYGMDWLSSNLFSGAIIHNLKAYAAIHAPPSLHAAIGTLVLGDLDLPQFCDAIAVSGPATASGKDSYFARDFQLATALVFQDVQTMVIFNPSDDRKPLVAALAPGMVGGMTILNSEGVIMGVDTLRSAEGNPDQPGLNSLLLIRAALHEASTSADVAAYAANAKRGCPFLYPVSDADGNAIVLEVGAWNESNTPANALEHVSSAALRDILPSNSFVQTHSKPDARHGLYVRSMDYNISMDFLDYNVALFKHAGVEYDPAMVTNDTGMIYSDWKVENADWKKASSAYFSPTRTPPHTIAVSNFAITPQLRLTQMNLWCDIFPGEAMQYRYDTLNQALHKSYGEFTFEMVRETITFLSPSRTPGYWHDYYDPSNPNSAKVEGIICVADLNAKKLATKGGYWADGWLELSLSAYV